MSDTEPLFACSTISGDNSSIPVVVYCRVSRDGSGGHYCNCERSSAAAAGAADCNGDDVFVVMLSLTGGPPAGVK